MNFNQLILKTIFLFVLINFVLVSNAQTVLISPLGDGGFENGATFASNGWNEANTGPTNLWYIGTVPPGFTNNSAYVSNTGGATWTFTNTSATVVHFWRDVTFPAGETDIILNFDWQALGETGSWDALMVSLAPTSYVPTASSVSIGTAGLAAPAVTLQQLWNVGGVMNANIAIPSAVVGNCSGAVTLRLIFTWKNDTSGGVSPPAAIDNISLVTNVGPTPLAGTYTVGPGGTYTSLTLAAADIVARGVTGPVIFEMQTDYTSAGEVFPIVLNAFCGSSVVNTATVRPAPGATGLVVTSANAGPTIDLNTGNWWRIDGRPGGVGTNKELTIWNSATGGQALRFINDASNNMVHHCLVRGVNTSTTNGVILFSTTVLAGGNDNNTIDQCNIFDGATSPVNGIYSSGTTTTLAQYNNSNTISNNNIFNNYHATSSHVGVFLAGGNSDWIITGNSFYQTVGRTTSGTVNAFQSSSTLNNNITFSDNFIGGSAPNCGGAPMTYLGGTIYRGLQVTVGTIATSNFTGNTFQNLSVTSTNTSAAQSLISLLSGRLNCSGNTIGSQSSSANIVFSLSGSAARLQAILAGTGTPELTTISDNTIGGMDLIVTGVPATVPAFFPISIQGTTAGHNYTITNNIIGSPDFPNSVTSNANSSFIGIISFSGALGQVISNNLIANITGLSVGTGSTVAGINLQGSGTSPALLGSFIADGNTIRNLTASSAATFVSSYGIIVSGTAEVNAPQLITNNTIHSISNINPSSIASIAGMLASVNSTTLSTISSNFMHSLSLLTSASGAAIRGFILNAGRVNFSNNMFRLGINADGTDILNSYNIQGILENVGTIGNFYHNSIFIGGENVAIGASNSFAFVSASTSIGRNYRNNIFYNGRSNAAATGKHYAISIPGAVPNQAGITSEYNILTSSGVGGHTGLFNAIDRSLLSDWQAATGFDNNSISGNPQFINPTGDALTVDLHISPVLPTPVEGGGVLVALVAEDFDNQNRASFSPVDIGADAGNFVIDDISGPGISYMPASTSCGSGNVNIDGVIVTDATGIPLVGSLIPRIYYRKGAGTWFSQPGVFISGTAQNSTWNFTMLAADMGGLTGGDMVHYYIVAQDITVNENLVSFPGGVVADDVNTIITHPALPATLTVVNALSGTYSIGVGGDFTTLTSAVMAYNNSCLLGPVVFNLIDATYPSETFPIIINANAFSSATNTLTIHPDAGNSATISGSSTCIINFNGADWVTLDGSNSGGNDRSLTIQNTNTAAATAVVCVTSLGTSLGATNDKIKNCNLIAGSVTAITTFGIFAGGATLTSSGTGNDNDNLEIRNNAISKAYYGIYAAATTLGVNDNLVIADNLIGSSAGATEQIGQRGIHVVQANNALITQNTVFNIIGTPTNPTGIFIGAGVQNSSITRNDIRSLKYTGTGGFGGKGIDVQTALANANLIIANNFVSDILGDGWSAMTSDAIVGIRIGTTTAQGGIYVYYNSVNLFGEANRASTLTICAAISIGTGATNIFIKNNILRNEIINNLNPNGKSYAIYSGSAASAFTSINNNDYFVLGSQGFTGFLSSDRLTLSDWQVATGQDAMSVAVFPVFVSDLDLHLVPGANPLLSGGGMLVGGVIDDYDGNLRSNPPTIGAHELNVLVCSVEILDVIADDYCGDIPNGVITISATCDNCTLEYSIDNGMTWSLNPVFTDVEEGSYTVLVRDAVDNICEETWIGNPVEIISLPLPLVSITSSDAPMCIGEIRQLIGDPAGGDFEVISGFGSIDINDILTAEAAGAIEISYTVSDINNCTASITQTIIVNSDPIAVIEISENSGNSPNDGIVCIGATVTLTASGGGTYEWSTGETSAQIVIIAVSTQSYTITVTSSEGCTSVTSIQITVNPNPIVEITPDDSIICPGESVLLTASGGISYLWDTGESTVSITVTPLNPSQYTVTATDSNGCSNSSNAEVDLFDPPVINNLSIIEPSDCVSEDGSISFGVIGDSPFTFNWETPNGTGLVQGSQNQEGLTVGTYFLTITDVNGCTSTAIFTLQGPGNCGNCPLMGPLTANPNPVCQFGEVNLEVTGLTDMNPTYGIIFKYFNAVPADPYIGGSIIENIPNNGLDGMGTSASTSTSFGTPGTYYIYTILTPTPTDFGCRPASSVTLVVNANPVIQISFTENSGNQPNDGIICAGATVTITASGGGTYMWSTGETSASIIVNPTPMNNFYSVTVTDVNGCSANSSIFITVNPNPVVTITITENSGNLPNDGVICRGSSVTLTASVGSSYLWSTGATTQQIVVAPLVSTTYNVMVTDVNGCTGNSSVNIVVNIPPTVTISGPTSICSGQSTTLTANGGNSFMWSTGATTQSINVAPASNTTYSVTATDVNGCTGVSSVLVTVVQNPTVNQVANQTHCNGQVVPAIVFSGTPVGVVFNWTRTPTAIGLAPTAGTGNIPSFTATNAGTTPLSSTFTVTPQFTSMGVTCNGTPMTFTITINPTPTVNPVNNIVTCAGLTVPSTVFTGSVPGTTYNWTRTPEPIGLGPLSGSGNVPAFVSTNPGMTAITSTFTVTPVFTSGGVSCPGQPITFTIRVEPTPTALCRNITLQLDANGNASITPADINNGSFGGTITISRSQFDCSNVGNNIVILTVTSPCNTTSTCSSTVTVQDNLAPIITCPPSRNVTLDPGLCCTYLAWADATATDNCPLVSTSGALFTTSAGTPGNFFNSFAGITFDVRNETGGPLTINGFRVPVTGSSVPATFNIYYTTTATTNVGNQANPAAWTLMGTYTTPGLPPVATAWNLNTFTQVNIGGLVLAPGQSKGIYVLLANYPTGGSLRYTDGNFTATNGTMTILSNGYGGTQVPFNNTFFPRAFVGEVQYGTLAGGLEVIQLSGPISGEEFCKDDSPWEVVYQATDGSGNSSTCSFDIAVRDYPNPVQSLACNDHVNVSVDESCEAVVNADMILEGGPYSCYDDYSVELRLNGVLLNPNNRVNWNHVGRTLEATVIGPNGNRCWGTILVEDKFAPNLVCEDAFAECGDDITPCASTGSVFIPGDTIQFPASFSQHGGGTAYSLSGNTLPGGVYFNLRNNSGGDLAVTGFGVRFGDPAFGQVNAPQTLQLYTAATFIGNETNAAAWTNVGPAIVDPIPPHFQTGTGPLGQARLTTFVVIPAGEIRGFHIFGATACPIFNYFNNTGPFTNGPWTCTGGPISFGLLSNLFQAGASSMPNIQVNTGIEGPAPCLPNGLRLGIDAVLTGNRTYRVNRNTGDPLLETCSDVTLTYSDQVDPADCQGQYWQTIIRNWIATDGYGNVSTCAQNINIAKSSLSNICEVLRDYDNIDLPAFDCDGNWLRDANGNPDASIVGGPGGSQSCNVQCAYNDINIPLCGPTSRARKILRRWTCVDWCEPVNRVEECDQIIKVMDNTGPTIVLDPARDSLTALPYTCFWDVRFARPTVSDNCSTNDADPLHNVIRISISGPGFDGDFYRKVNGIVTVNEQFFPRWINVQQGLPRLRLPVGDHTVIYRAEDACGNVTELPVPLIIRDIVAPVAICEKFRVASLGPDCRVRIPATSFDDGSYDNCGIVSMQVARMTTSTCYTPASSALVFRDSVDFCCVDITATEAQRTVMFRAIDAAGNSNTCMVIVEVQDKLLPVVVCPPDVTVDCRDHFGLTDAELEARFGAAVSTDNCAGQTGQSCFLNVTVVNSPDLECRQGTITRVYTATDAANNVGRCTQRITIVNNFPFDGSWYRVFTQIRNAQTYPQYPNGPYEDNTPAGQKVYPTQARANLRPINTLYPTRWDIVWPADLEVDFCGQALLPDSLAANPRYVVGSKPYIHREDFCAQIGMTYDEWEFDFDAGCKKIIRLWKVIDWCQPQTVFNPWMWEQVIKVIDTEGPEITAGPFNFCITAQDCIESVTLQAYATDNCATGDQLRWDWEIYLFGDRTNPIRNTVPNLRGDSLVLTRVFPTTPDGGPAHIIKYIVEDGCSNKTTREVEIRVRDCKKPTPICYNGLAVDLMPTVGMADVAAVLFNAGSYDNCTSQPALQYRIERLADGDGIIVPNGTILTVDCDDLGSLQVRFWVIDQFGNADFCETYLLVQNNMGADCEDITGDVSGLLFTENNEGVESVRIDVKSSGSISRSVVSNELGRYLVNVPLFNNYTITPYRNDNPANGVTTTDILLIQRHILGLQQLGTPYNLIAADANNSGSITAGDLVEIRKVILGKSPMFANNTSWRFVVPEYVFDDPTNAHAESFPESRVINPFLGNMLNENFYGIKIGDVNGSVKANSQSISGSISRSRTFEFNVEDVNMTAGNEYTVSFRASDIANVLGYQFTLNFKPEVVDFVGFEAGALNVTEEHFGFTMLKDGMITTSWNTTAPLTVEANDVLFTMTFRAKTSGMLSEVLSADSRFTSAEAISLEGAEIELNLVFNTTNGSIATGTYELYQNVPNPFTNETMINFSLPEAMDAVMTVFDVSGKVVKQINGSYAKGLNGIRMSKEELPSAGVLYYQLEAGSFKATKKMIIIE